MQEKVLELPFNKDAFIYSNKIPWIIAYRRKLKPYTIYIVLSVTLLLAGIFSEDDQYHGFAYIGGVLLLFLIVDWSRFLEKRSDAYKKIYRQADDYEKEQMDCTFIFSDYGIEYRDKEKQLNFRWDLLKRYIVFRGYILIYLKNTLQATIILSSEDLGEDYYQEFLILLKEKMSPPGKRIVESNVKL